MFIYRLLARGTRYTSFIHPYISPIIIRLYKELIILYKKEAIILKKDKEINYLILKKKKKKLKKREIKKKKGIKKNIKL